MDYLLGPSDEANARVAEIQERWARLQAWGIRAKLPFTAQQQRFVADFLEAWGKSPDPSRIAAATSDLVAMERYAEEYDHRRGGSFRAEPIKTAFDVEKSTRAIEAASAADKAAKAAAAVVKDAAKDLQEATRDAGVNLPLVVGIGTAVAILGVVLAIKSRPRVFPYYV